MNLMDFSIGFTVGMVMVLLLAKYLHKYFPERPGLKGKEQLYRIRCKECDINSEIRTSDAIYYDHIHCPSCGNQIKLIDPATGKAYEFMDRLKGGRK